MKQHPLSSAFPSMPDTDFSALVTDIEQFGQRESGIVLDGMVLDGWHRYRATEQLGIQFNYVEFEDEHPGTDPVAFVLSRNAFRRHLSASQRAAAFVACTNWRHAGRKAQESAPGATLGEESEKPAPGAALTTAEMAKAAHVSERTIRQAKAAERVGLGAAVRDGAVSAKQAATVAAMPEEQQQEIAQSGAAAMREIIAAANKQAKSAVPPSEKRVVPSPLDIAIRERDEAIDLLDDLKHTAAELQAEVEAYRASERGEGDKVLAESNKRILKLEGEIRRLEAIRDDWMNKHSELLKEVKKLKRQLDRGHA